MTNKINRMILVQWLLCVPNKQENIAKKDYFYFIKRYKNKNVIQTYFQFQKQKEKT